MFNNANNNGFGNGFGSPFAEQPSSSFGSPGAGAGTSMNMDPFGNNNVVSGQQGFGNPFDQKGFDSGLTQSKPNDFTSGSIRSVRVISCSFTELPEQAPMGFRPYVSHVNESGIIDKIPDFVRENRLGANFKSESINPIANDIISISSGVLGQINVVNGWNIRRYSCVIQAEVVRSNGNSQNYLVEGFTDTPEIQAVGDAVYVDPNLVIYVNNVTTFGQRTNIHNGQMSVVPTENYNVFNKDAFGQNTPINNIISQRPYDVANMSLSGILAGNTTSHIVDARASLATGSQACSVANNNPATYIAKIINDGIGAISRSNTDNLFNTTTMSNMLDTVSEPSIARNGFLQQLGRITNDYPTSVTSFSWKELTKLDPALTPTCSYLNLYTANQRLSFLPSSGLACDDITGSAHEHTFAAAVANSISDLLHRCKAYSVSIVGTNYSGMDEAHVTMIKTFNPEEYQQQALLMKELFVFNVMRLINFNTQYAYNIDVYANLWGETNIKINLGRGTYNFLLPNFANSMYNPCLTNNKVGTEQISRELLSIANKVSNEQYNIAADAKGFNNISISPI